MDMMVGSGHPLSSTSSTVELSWEKEKHRFTRIPYDPSGFVICALKEDIFCYYIDWKLSF